MRVERSHSEKIMIGRQTKNDEIIKDAAIFGAKARIDHHAGLRRCNVIHA